MTRHDPNAWHGSEDLAKQKKGDRRKVRIAARLRRETTMSWNWIATRLAMGTSGYAANCVRASRREGE